jgi:hypothetical protein
MLKVHANRPIGDLFRCWKYGGFGPLVTSWRFVLLVVCRRELSAAHRQQLLLLLGLDLYGCLGLGPR